MRLLHFFVLAVFVGLSLQATAQTIRNIPGKDIFIQIPPQPEKQDFENSQMDSPQTKPYWPKWVELGISTSSSGISSSPVSGFKMDQNMGYGVQIGGHSMWKNVDIYGGIHSSSRDLSLVGRNLGGVDTLRLSFGGRYTFEGSDRFKPYIQGGMQYTSIDGGGLGSGTLKLESKGRFGLTAGGGLNINLKNSIFENPVIDAIGISGGWKQGQTTTLRTTSGAKVSDIKLRDEVEGSLSIIKNF